MEFIWSRTVSVLFLTWFNRVTIWQHNGFFTRRTAARSFVRSSNVKSSMPLRHLYFHYTKSFEPTTSTSVHEEFRARALIWKKKKVEFHWLLLLFLNGDSNTYYYVFRNKVKITKSHRIFSTFFSDFRAK